MDNLAKLFELGLSGAAVMIIVTRSTLFRPLREWLDTKSESLGDLIHCPVCFGTWVSLLLATLFNLRLFGGWGLADWFFSALAIETLVVVFGFLIYFTAHHIYVVNRSKDQQQDQDQEQDYP